MWQGNVMQQVKNTIKINIKREQIKQASRTHTHLRLLNISTSGATDQYRHVGCRKRSSSKS